jgi:glutathione S-transferase
MKLFYFPPSARALAVLALGKHLALDCELRPIDLGRGDQLCPEYVALNPNKKMPTLEVDDGFALWESNAILFYLAAQRPDAGLWPADLRGQADVMRWLSWESAHWDAESWGMVAYEKSSKAVLGRGSPDPAFVARGEQNFKRFAAVLDGALKEKTWILGEQLTIADFSIGAGVPSAERLGLPVKSFPAIYRWYGKLSEVPAWRDAVAARDAAFGAWQSGTGRYSWRSTSNA